MAGIDRQEQDVAVRAAADNLRIDAATAEVLRRWEQASVQGLVLKGPALADWYAADPARSYLDCDMWVRPGDLEIAAAALAELGFQKLADERGLPEWWREHASTWARESDGVVVDLHRTLQGIGVSAEEAWETLWPRRELATVAGRAAPRLDVSARAMYVTLHAAHHGAGFGKALTHLERALRALAEPAWHEAAELARQLRAVDAFAAGLRLLPEGTALAERLELPATQSVKTALRASTPPPVALGFAQLAGAKTLRERLEIAGRKLFPPPGFVRHWWPPAARSRWMLLLGYLYRPLWLLRHAPRGARAWLEARRRTRGDH